MNDEIKLTPKTMVKAKVVHAMSMLQASYNKDDYKIVKEAALEKISKESLIF